ncbi:MAG: 2-amino-4-hydroxy-6-hydroxymethyldihydropteridine diphosphokinase [bacterium]|nr:2-amino-4-hydroxy-6-hydroxymethyldihydropteridine diphosphokinase [bacterium]
MAAKTVYLGLGTNIGNKRKNIREAVRLLRRDVKIVKVSSLYKSKPVGYLEQPDFLNAVLEIKTSLTPRQLLKQVKAIERTMGRVKTVRWGSRLIDIDILLYDNKVIKTKKLVIPHSSMHCRWFVLKPLAEIAPQLVHPELKQRIKKLLADLKD